MATAMAIRIAAADVRFMAVMAGAQLDQFAKEENFFRGKGVFRGKGEYSKI